MVASTASAVYGQCLTGVSFPAECFHQRTHSITLRLAVLDAQRLKRTAKGLENRVEFIRRLR